MSTTLNQERMVDPVLTQFAFGYKNQSMIAEILLPRVDVDSEKGLYPKFGKESFQIYHSIRGLTAESPFIEIGSSTDDYILHEHSLNAAIDDREYQESNWPIGVEQKKLNALLGNLAVEKEYSVASSVNTATNYGASNQKILDGTAGKKYWSVYSGADKGDPIGDINTAKERIRTMTGQYPNIMELSAIAFAVLKEHPDITDRIKYSQVGIVTVELLAALFDIPKIVIGRSIYSDGTTFYDLWEDNAILAVAETGIEVPCFGHVLNRRGYPRVTKYRLETRKSNVVNSSELYSHVICSWDSAYIIKDVKSP